MPSPFLGANTVFFMGASVVPTAAARLLGSFIGEEITEHRELLADGNSTEYFHVPAFFITFRETIEAVVIISILLRFLEKIDRADLKTAVWKGSFIGLGIALVIGVGFIIAFYETNEQFFKGDAEYILEGILMLVASFIITVLSASMIKITNMREKWERKLEVGIAKAEAKGDDLRYGYMFWLPLTAVLREGIETVIFLAGTSAGYPVKGIPIPGILGIAVGLLVGYFIFRLGKEASLRKLLVASTILLLFIAAGLFSYGWHELQETGMFGTWEPEEKRPWRNRHLWDVCYRAPNDHEFWSVMRALFGYQCRPTPVEIISWCLYWVLAFVYFFFKLRTLYFKRRAGKGESNEDGQILNVLGTGPNFSRDGHPVAHASIALS